jgi:hypothetical protein
MSQAGKSHCSTLNLSADRRSDANFAVDVQLTTSVDEKRTATNRDRKLTRKIRRSLKEGEGESWWMSQKSDAQLSFAVRQSNGLFTMALESLSTSIDAPNDLICLN